jgi:uncharacterized membrane protein
VLVRAIHRASLAVVIASAIVPSIARADRYEASTGASVHGGVARVGETGSAAVVVPSFGAQARLSHAWSDSLAWRVAAAATITQPATFTNATAIVDGRTEYGDINRRTITSSVVAGAELRLGARVIPTVSLAVGPQLRYRTASDLGTFIAAIPSALSLDAVASIGVGVDLRLNRHRVIGVALQFDHAQSLGGDPSLDVIAISLRFDHYWYPRWWAPSW